MPAYRTRAAASCPTAVHSPRSTPLSRLRSQASIFNARSPEAPDDDDRVIESDDNDFL